MNLIEFLGRIKEVAQRAPAGDAEAFLRNMTTAIEEVTEYQRVIKNLQSQVAELSEHIMRLEPPEQWPEFVKNLHVMAGLASIGDKEEQS